MVRQTGDEEVPRVEENLRRHRCVQRTYTDLDDPNQLNGNVIRRRGLIKTGSMYVSNWGDE